MGAALKTGPEGRPRPALLKAPCLAPEPVPLVWSTLGLAPRPPALAGRQAEPDAGRGLLNGRPNFLSSCTALCRPPFSAWRGGDVFHSPLHKFHPAVPSSFPELNFSEDATSPRPCACAEEKREGARGGHFGWVG